MSSKRVISKIEEVHLIHLWIIFIWSMRKILLQIAPKTCSTFSRIEWHLDRGLLVRILIICIYQALVLKVLLASLCLLIFGQCLDLLDDLIVLKVATLLMIVIYVIFCRVMDLILICIRLKIVGVILLLIQLIRPVILL